VEGVHDVRARWAGRSLFVVLAIALDPMLPLDEAHAIAEAVRHALLHEVDGVAMVDVHMDPAGDAHAAAHADTAHHAQPRPSLPAGHHH
jgi:divalent metal cation (Fe/Co/Zn/Cd) transporter